MDRDFHILSQQVAQTFGMGGTSTDAVVTAKYEELSQEFASRGFEVLDENEFSENEKTCTTSFHRDTPVSKICGMAEGMANRIAFSLFPIYEKSNGEEERVIEGYRISLNCV